MAAASAAERARARRPQRRWAMEGAARDQRGEREEGRRDGGRERGISAAAAEATAVTFSDPPGDVAVDAAAVVVAAAAAAAAAGPATAKSSPVANAGVCRHKARARASSESVTTLRGLSWLLTLSLRGGE